VHFLKKAYLSEELENRKVKCLACAHECIIPEGGKGKCLIRSNHSGILFLDAYGSAVSVGVDPIEKKPLFHFLPGSSTFSFGTLSCNFDCLFCQNFELSMNKTFQFKENLSPKEAVDLALSQGCKSISYTYNEPTIFSEYMLDTARLARESGLRNVMVTNGFISSFALEKIADVIDAVNVDLKSFSEKFYEEQCGAGASLLPVLDAIRFFHRKKVWLEVTTLVIPDLNDSDDELRNIANFIASVDKDIPWHVSRFFPRYKVLDKDVTPISTIKKAVNIGREEGLNYIYEGNVPGSGITRCPSCNQSVLIRNNEGTIINMKDNKCSCGYHIRGVFS
jgi:pyruvate formate lyase activating enzyme